MKAWIVANANYFLSNWEDLLMGGIIVVSVVIFLMGVLKGLLLNKIKNDLARKVLLAWTSLIIVLPVTAIYLVVKGVSMDYFWFVYAVNCVSTILIYWGYENTALRNCLHVVGKKIVLAFVSGKSTSEKDAKKLLTEVAKNLADTEESSEPKYKNDDLDNI